MKVIKKILLGSLFMAAAISGTAFAEDTGIYGGLNLGVGKPDINMPNGRDKEGALKFEVQHFSKENVAWETTSI